jgi:small subunit ribosomal protein S20
LPQHKSCEKRIRQDKKKNPYNRAVKSSVRTATKKFLTAPEADADELYKAVASELDRAAKKGVIPRKRADRRKSRLAKQLNKRKAAAA